MTPASYGHVLAPAAAVRAAALARRRTARSWSTPSASSAGTPRAEGCPIFLEPLNRYEDHMVNRLAEGVSLLRETGLPTASGCAPTPTT